MNPQANVSGASLLASRCFMPVMTTMTDQDSHSAFQFTV
jgi:hypothetical protein